MILRLLINNNLTFPTVSGTQGGGNLVHENYEIGSYPTVIVITPDHQIVEQYIYPPTTENITDAVIAAGGIWVSTPENENIVEELSIYPNPANSYGYLSLYTLKSIKLSYGIYDMWGKELFLSEPVQVDEGQQRIAIRSKQLNPGPDIKVDEGQQRIAIPVDKLNNGMYIVKLLIDEKTPETVRFIVAK